MITPIGYEKTEAGSGGQIIKMILATLRGKGAKGKAPRVETPEQFRKLLGTMERKEHIRIWRGSRQALGDVLEGVRRTVHSQAKAVLRAGDWVISGRSGEKGMEYELAYGLEGETVLLAGGRKAELSQWQGETEYYWFVTVTFRRPKKAAQAGNLSPAETCWLQRRLNHQLGTRLAVDGSYGPETAKAVEQFRKKWRQETGVCADPPGAGAGGAA